jgi:hypothetical protein
VVKNLNSTTDDALRIIVYTELIGVLYKAGIGLLFIENFSITVTVAGAAPDCKPC